MLQHRDLARLGGRAVDRFDVLGEDVLAAGENDQLLAPADDVEIAELVEPAEIAGAKETVLGERFRRGLGIVPIAGEHVRALGQNLAVARLRILGGAETQFDPLDRQADAFDARPAWRIEGQDR